MRKRGTGYGPELRLYFREIDRTPLLTAAEEVSLALAVAQGDADARKRMIEANLRLVVFVARKFQGRGMGLADLVAEGNLGLIEAVDRFKPAYGVRFATYASYWIRKAIMEALALAPAEIRVPKHAYVIMGRFRRMWSTLKEQLGRQPSFSETAYALGLSKAQRRLVLYAQRAMSVAPVSEYAATLYTHGALGESLEADDVRAELSRRMATLTDREQEMLSLRFGMRDEPPLTLAEIGSRFGLTREGVRAIVKHALARLARGGELACSA